MAVTDPLSETLIATVQARPRDPEPRAVLEDHLLERGHPGARFVALDRELSETPRDDPRFAELDAELAEVTAQLEPAWMIAVGEIDAFRYDVVGDTRHALIAMLLRADIPFRMADPDRVFERGLRRIDARILAGGLGPGASIEPNLGVTTLARLRTLIPRPHRWQIRQPRFNHLWPARGTAHQRAPQPVELPAYADVYLEDCGPRKINTIKIIRRVTGLGLKDAKDLAENGGRLASSMPRREAVELVRELREIGASAEIYEDVVVVDTDLDLVRGGDLVMTGLRATDDEVAVGGVRWRWISSHEAEPELEPTLTIPLSGALERTAEFIAAHRQVTDALVAALVLCRECGDRVRPQDTSDGLCGGCAEAAGIVH